MKAIRAPWVRPGRSILSRGVRNCRLVSIRSYATDSSTIKSPPKSFKQITREMAERAQQARKSPRVPEIKANFNSHYISKEAKKPLRSGDVVLLNLEPHVVLKPPQTPLDDYLLVSHVGLVRHAMLHQIDALLMPLVPSSIFDNAEMELFASQDTTGAPLKITSEDELSEYDDNTSLDKPAVRVVSHWVYQLTSVPLRQLYTVANNRAHDLLPRILQKLEDLQHEIDPVVLPFTTFLEAALQKRAGKASIIDFYAALICLDHYSLEFKHQLRVSFTGNDAIMIYSKTSEKRNIQAQKRGVGEQFVLDYARSNLPLGSSESRAIELLRAQFPKAKYIDAAVAAELLQLPRGGLYENHWNQWMFNTAQSATRAAQINKLFCEQEDKLAQIRRIYDEAPVFCIDGPDAKEIDDGISLKQVSPSRYTLGIHIANPTAGLDLKQAISQIQPLTSSVYLGENLTLSMLPQHIIDQSGLHKSEARTLSIFVDVDLTDGIAVSNIRVEPLLIKDCRNIQYSEVSRNNPQFTEFYRVARQLAQQRFRKGAFSFKKYTEQEDSAASSVMAINSKNDGEVIVTEFMNLANQAAAEYATSHSIPLLYRSQFLQIQSESLRKAYWQTHRKSAGLLGLPWQPLALRARTWVYPSRHAGIGANSISRFTSPLRRLDDLITHAQLQAHLRGQPLPFTTAELAGMCEWMQVSQELINKLSKADAQYDQFSQLRSGQTVRGIVGPAMPGTTRDLALVSVYLPEYGVTATYTDKQAAKLRVEEEYEFKLTEVSAAGRYAKVVLKGEN